MRLGRSLVASALASAVGTVAMDYTLYRRYRAGGGTQWFWQWEFAEGVKSWDQGSAPGQLDGRSSVS
jgi:hypothetical protein